MKNATFSDFRNHAREYFDQVEEGNTIQIYRHGKPIAILSPIGSPTKSRFKSFKPLMLKGVSVSKLILKERLNRII